MTFPNTHEGWQDLARTMAAQAAAATQRKEDSFQRSDTDGCLSQWASGLSAELHEAQAEIARNDGMAEFTALFQGDRRVDAKLVSVYNRYTFHHESKWVVADSDPVAALRKWIPRGEKSRVQKQLGLHEAPEMAAAWAKFEGRGTGLSGQCWVQVYRRTETE